MKLQTRVIPFEIKTADGEAGDGSEFAGYGAIFRNLDWKGDIFAPGAFAQDIAFTSAEGKVRDEHGITTGRILDASEQAQGLFLKARISATTAGLDQRILVKDRVINRLSVGYCTLERQWLESVEAVKSWWQSIAYTPDEDDLMMLGRCGCARLITRAKVYEVSTTWLPCNDKATITDVKSGQHDRPTFDAHSLSTLAVVEEFCERAERLKELRSADGRTLSKKSLGQLSQLRSRLDSLLTATEPPADGQVDADMAEYDRYLEMGERLRGAN